MPAPLPHTPHRQRTPPPVAALDHYTVRFLAALVLSLLVVGACFRLPWYAPLEYVGWQFAPDSQPFRLDLIDLPPVTHNAGGFEAIAASSEHKAAVQDTAASEPLPSIPDAHDPRHQLSRIETSPPVLEMADQPPDILGGLGAYYVHINYPEAAIKAGIEGRLVLTYIVETDGSVSDIHLLRSLHPLCDSAAVQALRHTRFVPGRQNGEAVRVRMRLPVQFKLLGGQVPVSKNSDL